MGTVPGASDYRAQHNAAREEQKAGLSKEWAAEVAEKVIALINSRVRSPTRDEIVRIILGEQLEGAS